MRRLRKSIIIIMCVMFVGIENVQTSVLAQTDYNNRGVIETIIITGQPVSQTYVAGQKVTAKVLAEGTDLKYQC